MLIMKTKRPRMNRNLLEQREKMVGTNCPICGIKMCKPKLNRLTSATIEHIDRLAEGGRNDLNNIIIICRLCNLGRNHTALICKNKNQLGYPEWSKISLYNSEFSRATINAHFSNIDSIFWNFFNEHRVSQPD